MLFFFLFILNRDRSSESGKKSGKQRHPDRTRDSSFGRKSLGVVVAAETTTESTESTDMAEGNRFSPPKAEVDDSPLQHAMDRNKECK